MVEPLTLESFQPHIGTPFEVPEIEPGLVLRLDTVEVHTQHGDGRQPFSLFFVGAEPVLPQRIYTLKHDALGTLEIFLVPVSQDSADVMYEAVFN